MIIHHEGRELATGSRRREHEEYEVTKGHEELKKTSHRFRRFEEKKRISFLLVLNLRNRRNLWLGVDSLRGPSCLRDFVFLVFLNCHFQSTCLMPVRRYVLLRGRVGDGAKLEGVRPAARRCLRRSAARRGSER